MLLKPNFSLCSKIHTEHTNSMWSQARIFECETLWYVKLPVGFKMLNATLCFLLVVSVIFCTPFWFASARVSGYVLINTPDDTYPYEAGDT
jgi:hypothetical protein